MGIGSTIYGRSLSFQKSISGHQAQHHSKPYSRANSFSSNCTRRSIISSEVACSHTPTPSRARSLGRHSAKEMEPHRLLLFRAPRQSAGTGPSGRLWSRLIGHARCRVFNAACLPCLSILGPVLQLAILSGNRDLAPLLRPARHCGYPGLGAARDNLHAQTLSACLHATWPCASPFCRKT
jgi:hypothetical protein